MSLRLVQFFSPQGNRKVGVPSEDGATLVIVDGIERVLDLANVAINAGASLAETVRARLGRETASYPAAVADKRLLPPVDHPDPCRMHVSGTGLTHLGSADTRDKMHQVPIQESSLTDSMKMFRWGLKDGRPAPDAIGVQPEWFYKGNGRFVVPPEATLSLPRFAEDGGEEPELAMLYLVAPDGTPVRLGAALGNEYSDHIMERRNYLFLAHSKLRQSSFGPELLIGEIPADIRGMSRIRRNGQLLWEKPFLTGEANMSHSLTNLEHHHFKYPEHRVPGDVHVHFLGTATLSFADDVRPEPGDVFEIEASGFGRALRNPLGSKGTDHGLVAVRSL